MDSLVRWVILSVISLALAPYLPAQDIRPYPDMNFAPPAADTGELLVDFENDESPTTILSFFNKIGVFHGQYTWFSREENWVRLTNVTSGILDRLKQSSNIEAVEPNYYLYALFVPNDPYYKYQWHMDLVGMKEAWEYPLGAPVTVAVIDTGIAYENHDEYFKAEDLGEFQFVKPFNFVTGKKHANDDHGHGTHVAGTIAQLTNNQIGVAGVAPNIKLMPLKVLNSHGYGTLSDVAAAIRYAADNGAKVINMSLGGPFPSFILRKACKYAREKGVVIVCAAGNSGRSGISYPANYPECISVSAVRFDRTLTWYSSFGKGLTIAAPGGDMNVDQNGDGLMDGVLQNTLDLQDRSRQGYFLFQGTSMATPHVAAAAALLVSHGISDPDKVTEYLQKTASPVDGGSAEKYGAGILNIDAALSSAFFYRNVKVGMLALALVIALIGILNHGKNKLQKIPLNAFTLLGLLFGSTGLFFIGKIPFLRDTFLLSHPVPEWSLIALGTDGSANPIFFSALPAICVMFLFYAWKRTSPISIGFSCGIAAFLLLQALSPVSQLSWIPGQTLEFAWLLIHAFVCIGLAAIAAFRMR